MLPSLPNELTSNILELTTLSLVEQERHDSRLTGHTNAFLLAASLVSHTWRNIAQPLLLKHGLVDPSRAEIFISEVERAGLEDTLAAVRIGVPASGAAVSKDEARASGIGLGKMLWEFQALRELELVGQHFRILGLVAPPNQITSLIFAASSRANFEALLIGLCTAFNPLRLTIIEDAWGVSDDHPLEVRLACIDELKRMLGPVRDLHFTIQSNQGTFYPACMMKHPANLLKAIRFFRLEIKSPGAFWALRIQTQPSTSFLDSLDRLDTHLDWLQDSAVAPSTTGRHVWLQDSAGQYGPHLTALKILCDPEGVQSNSTVSPEDKILNHISNLATLKELEVPDCWRSDAIEAACEAKGVVLTWTPKCKPLPSLLSPSS